MARAASRVRRGDRNVDIAAAPWVSLACWPARLLPYKPRPKAKPCFESEPHQRKTGACMWQFRRPLVIPTLGNSKRLSGGRGHSVRLTCRGGTPGGRNRYNLSKPKGGHPHDEDRAG